MHIHENVLEIKTFVVKRLQKRWNTRAFKFKTLQEFTMVIHEALAKSEAVIKVSRFCHLLVTCFRLKTLNLPLFVGTWPGLFSFLGNSISCDRKQVVTVEFNKLFWRSRLANVTLHGEELSDRTTRLCSVAQRNYQLRCTCADKEFVK